MRSVHPVAAAFVALALASCGDNRVPSVDAAIARCDAESCRNDGVCVESASGARCACAPGYAGERCELAVWSVPAPTRDLDILFVVDDSAFMADEQQRLVGSFDDLVATLTDIGGALPNLHVGVVSSSVGAAGQTGVPGCAGQGDDGALQATVAGTAMHCPSLAAAFASDVAAGSARETNYTGSLADTFACLATLGDTGCGFEMHLESAWRALQPGRNEGFYRPTAQLALVILANEDDCSAGDGTLFGDPAAGIDSVLGPRTSFRCHEFGVVCDDDPDPRSFGEKTGCRALWHPMYELALARYVDFFAAEKPDPRRLLVATIAGPFDGTLAVIQEPTPGAPAGYAAVKRSCGYDEADPAAGASPAVRLTAVSDALDDHAIHASSCDPSYADTMRAIGTQIATRMASITCLDLDLADADPAEGVQPACDVKSRAGDLVTDIPRCTAERTPPCWSIGPDPRACPDAASALTITTDGVTSSATVEARCETR